ncbi:MAG TPA: twin-arginine translocase subunit TatC [Candidatus Limnocylindrales bacterium]|nr:twin-arginine translocase subunit TatC [Candidatus Limnocylindrales bacterium]
MADADAIRDAGLPVSLGTPEAEPPASAPAPAPGTSATAEMTLVDHLTELRDRLIKVVLAVAVTSAIGFYFTTPIIGLLVAPLPNEQLQFTGVGDAFFINVKIAIVVGIILAMPVILYQLWAFVAPGLTDDERRTVRPWIPIALVFFAMGVSIAYVIMPFAVQFLLQFSSQYLNPLITAGPYFDFVTMLFLVFGLIMEFPILLYGLSRVGIVTSKRLSDSRRMAILAIAIFAAAATPGGDLVSPFVLGVTMYVLFEGTIVAIRRSGK